MKPRSHRERQQRRCRVQINPTIASKSRFVASADSHAECVLLSLSPELNQTARTIFPKEYLCRKQNFQKASCAKWPLPSCRKLFHIFGGEFDLKKKTPVSQLLLQPVRILLQQRRKKKTVGDVCSCLPGFQRQPAAVARRPLPRGGGYQLDSLDFRDDARGWRLDMDMVIIYIYSVNWVVGFFVFCFLCYLFFPSF